MARPKTDSEYENFSKYRLPTKDRLGESEMIALDRELQKYMVTKDIHFPADTTTTVTLLDENAFMKARGVLSKDDGIKIKGFTPSVWNDGGTKLIKIYDMEPIAYEQVKEDLAQWKRWRNKDATKNLMSLDEMSKQLAESKRITSNAEMEF